MMVKNNNFEKVLKMFLDRLKTLGSYAKNSVHEVKNSIKSSKMALKSSKMKIKKKKIFFALSM